MARAGVCAYLLARQTTADKLLQGVTSDGVAMFVHGQCLTSLNRAVVNAADRFEQAEAVMIRSAVHCVVPVKLRASGKLMSLSRFAVWPPPQRAARLFQMDASGLIAATLSSARSSTSSEQLTWTRIIHVLVLAGRRKFIAR